MKWMFYTEYPVHICFYLKAVLEFGKHFFLNSRLSLDFGFDFGLYLQPGDPLLTDQYPDVRFDYLKPKQYSRMKNSTRANFVLGLSGLLF